MSKSWWLWPWLLISGVVFVVAGIGVLSLEYAACAGVLVCLAYAESRSN